MNRRLRCLAAGFVATIALGASAGAVAWAVQPPAGTPDLSKMTLQRADLGPAGTVADGYVKPTTDERAQYDRNFAGPSTTAGLKLAAIETDIILADSKTDARGLFHDLQVIYGSKLGHDLLAADIEKGNVGVTRRQIVFGKLRSIGVGAQSLLESITVHGAKRTGTEDVFTLRIAGVVANVLVVAGAPKLSASVPTALARTIALHITTVLAAGSTGPTGPTGSTGTTGPTGATGATG